MKDSIFTYNYTTNTFDIIEGDFSIIIRNTTITPCGF